MPQTDHRLGLDLRSPEFAAIRGELARLFITHKIDLKMSGWTDERIVTQTVDIAATLMLLVTHALTHGDDAWLERHRWFGDACERLFNDQAAVPLDA
jgi:hypothetical protein